MYRLKSSVSALENLVGLLNKSINPSAGITLTTGSFTITAGPTAVTPGADNGNKNTSITLQGTDGFFTGPTTIYYNRVFLSQLIDRVAPSNPYVIESSADFPTKLASILSELRIDATQVTVSPGAAPGAGVTQTYTITPNANSLIYGPTTTRTFSLKNNQQAYDLLLKGDGTISGNTFLNADVSGNNAVVTRVAGSVALTASSVGGRAPSIYGGTTSTSSNQQLRVEQGEIIAFGTGDFTVEMRVYNTSNTDISKRFFQAYDTIGGTVYMHFGLARSGVAGLWTEVYSQNVGYMVTQASGNYSPTLLPISAWHHFALSRKNGTTRCFINGIKIAEYADATNYPELQLTFFSSPNVQASRNMPGYMDDIAICRWAKYEANFTPPAEINPNVVP